MPLIRYSTGDVSRFLTARCACGSNLKHLDRLQGRSVYRSNDIELPLEDMDEALFTLDDIVDFGLGHSMGHFGVGSVGWDQACVIGAFV